MRLLLSVAAILFAHAAAKSNVETRMRTLEDQLQELQASGASRTSNVTTVPHMSTSEAEQRRSQHLTQRAFSGFDLNKDSAYMICPAFKHENHCLHVGDADYYGNGFDVKVRPNPTAVEQIAMGKPTWQSSLWRFEVQALHPKFIYGLVKSESARWQGNPLFIMLSAALNWASLTWEQAAVGWGGDGGIGKSNFLWQVETAGADSDGRQLWTFMVGYGMANEREYLHVGNAWDVTSVAKNAGDAINEGTLWVIKEVSIRPLPAGPTTLSSFVPGRYFKVCPAMRHRGSCLDAGHGQTRVSVSTKPAASSEFRAFPSQVWQIFQDYDGMFVIESVQHQGSLLHVDERYAESVTVHPTAPNEGSRWRITERDLVDGKTSFSIQPAQRHPGTYLHVGGAPWDIGSYALGPQHDGSLWHIEEI